MHITPGAPPLTEAEFEYASQVFLSAVPVVTGCCAKGATGKPLTPDITQQRGTEYLKALISYGTPAGCLTGILLVF